jgi:hypothetical protein
MQIGEPPRTSAVEPIEILMNEPTAEPEPHIGCGIGQWDSAGSDVG